MSELSIDRSVLEGRNMEEKIREQENFNEKLGRVNKLIAEAKTNKARITLTALKEVLDAREDYVCRADGSSPV